MRERERSHPEEGNEKQTTEIIIGDDIKRHERELRERKSKTELISFGANEISAKIWNEMPELWTEGKFSTGNFDIFKDIDMNEGRFIGEIHRPKVR